MAMAEELILKDGFPLDHWLDLWNWSNNPRSNNWSDEYAHITEETFKSFLESKLKEDKTWAIFYTGELIGYIAFNLDYNCFRGITLNPTFRNKGIGTQAIFQVLELLNTIKDKKAMFFSSNHIIKKCFKNLSWKHLKTLTSFIEQNNVPIDIEVWGEI